MSGEDSAFYDALAENGSARELMAHEQLRLLAQMLVRAIHSSATLDWTKKESVRAKMRIEVRKLLARYGYQPDLQRAAVDLVIRQAELLAPYLGLLPRSPRQITSGATSAADHSATRMTARCRWIISCGWQSRRTARW